MPKIVKNMDNDDISDSYFTSSYDYDQIKDRSRIYWGTFKNNNYINDMKTKQMSSDIYRRPGRFNSERSQKSSDRKDSSSKKDNIEKHR